jgi:hypothetical protein
MNPNSAKNWTLSSYTNDTWTDLVDEPAIVSTISIANTTAGPITAELRLSDGDNNNLAVIVPANSLVGYDAFIVDIKSIPVTGGQTIQAKGSAPGLNFLAGGAVEAIEE